MQHAGVRRTVTVTALVLLAVALTVTTLVWAVISTVRDVAQRNFRFPTVRLMAFFVCWAWIELAGVLVLGAVWVAGRSRDLPLNYRIQAWWCGLIISALRRTVGLQVEIAGTEGVGSGPFVVMCRHASLADSIISCYVVNNTLGLAPRYVLKSDLRMVPCLDILGDRAPNRFVVRGSDDVQAELDGLAAMMDGLSNGQAAVIFPEGSRANPAKRTRELERLRERHPARHSILSGLSHLIPPKPAGAKAMLDAAPHADVITVCHSGLDGLDTFPGMLKELARRRVVARIEVTVHPRADVDSAGFTEWIDARWVEMDRSVAGADRAPA